MLDARRPTASLRLLLLAIMAWLATGCAGTRGLPAGTSGAHDPDPTRQAIVRHAHALLGTPYRYGGADPGGLDCSGLVLLAYQRAGVQVPRDTVAQFQAGATTSRLRPGDLVFYRIGSPQVSHVGIYVGNGEMIHASSGSHQVRRVRIDADYWRRRWAGAITLLDTPAAPVQDPYLAWTPRVSGG